METLRIDIINPKAKRLIKNLADMGLVRIRKTKKSEKRSSFIGLLEQLRSKSKEAPTLEEITSEVESVRADRYEK